MFFHKYIIITIQVMKFNTHAITEAVLESSDRPVSFYSFSHNHKDLQDEQDGYADYQYVTGSFGPPLNRNGTLPESLSGQRILRSSEANTQKSSVFEKSQSRY